MSHAVGRSLPLSLGRRVVSDFLYASMPIPTVCFQLDLGIAELVVARQLANPRPSWCSIFTKAYAKVVASRPDLRRAYLAFPWERLFEYSKTSADIVIASRLGDENTLVTGLLVEPESCPLPMIDCRIAAYKERPLELSASLRQSLLLARFPRLLRRWIWWWLLNGSGQLRGQYIATFGVSSVSNWGVDSLSPISPWITLLHYGAVDGAGRVTVRMTYDHRVLDGSGPATALVEMEHFLKTDILTELKTMRTDMLKAG